MRARRREINIFNMSLLDILCGALGAFCFMMIVALPYYIPPGKARDLRKSQEETAKLMHDLDKMKERLPDQKSIEEMEAMLKRLEAQIKALQGQVNILTAEKEELERKVNQLAAEKQELLTRANQLLAENEQLRARAQQLEAEKAQLAQENQTLQARNQSLEHANEKLQALLQAKKSFTILVSGEDFGQGLDVILFKSSIVEKGPSSVFDSWVNGTQDSFHTVRKAMLLGHGLAFDVVEDSPTGAEGKLFLRLTNPPDLRKKTSVIGAIVGDEMRSAPVHLPRVTLYPERYWILLGTVTIVQNNQPTFKEATDPEREAAWQTLTGATPPPTPTPTPTPSDAERAAAEAERAKYEAQRIRMKEATGKFIKVMNLPMDQKHEAEILQLADELLRDLPPRDHRRREVDFQRNRVLEMKAQREGGQRPPLSSPNEKVSPSPRQPAPVPSPS